MNSSCERQRVDLSRINIVASSASEWKMNCSLHGNVHSLTLVATKSCGMRTEAIHSLALAATTLEALQGENVTAENKV